MNGQRAKEQGGGSLKSGLVPDYLCLRCDHGHFGGKEPLHCTRCGWTQFEKVDEIKTAGQFDGIIGTVKRIMRDAEAARRAVHKSTHRRRAKIVNQLGRIERMAENCLRKMTEIPNPLGDAREATAEQIKTLTGHGISSEDSGAAAGEKEVHGGP